MGVCDDHGAYWGESLCPACESLAAEERLKDIRESAPAVVAISSIYPDIARITCKHKDYWRSHIPFETPVSELPSILAQISILLLDDSKKRQLALSLITAGLEKEVFAAWLKERVGYHGKESMQAVVDFMKASRKLKYNKAASVIAELIEMLIKERENLGE